MCILLSVFIFLYRIFDLPSPSDLSQLIVKWYKSYGLVIVFFSAIAESLFVISIYLPGSLAIILAVYSLGSNFENLLFICLYVIIGFTISNIINYFLGKYGYYRLLLFFKQRNIITKMQYRLERSGLFTVFLTGIHPNFLAITMVCLGIARISFYKSLINSVISVSFWVILWTYIASKVVTKINLKDPNQSVYLLLIFFLWGVFLIIKSRFEKKISSE